MLVGANQGHCRQWLLARRAVGNFLRIAALNIRESSPRSLMNIEIVSSRSGSMSCFSSVPQHGVVRTGHLNRSFRLTSLSYSLSFGPSGESKMSESM